MEFKSSCKKTLAVIVCLTLILAFVPGIPPHINFSSFEVEPPVPFEGPLAKNNLLDSSERLFEGYLKGPESIASRADDEIFVSAHGGDIVRIWGENWDKSQVITTIGPGCAGDWEEHICGRPLGLRFGNDGRLLVADAYLGIFAVDVDTGKKECLVNSSEPIEGVKPLLTDDLDMDSAGNIYWSDASSNSSLADGLLALSSDPSGRLFKYDPKTKKNTVLLSNLHFANGVQLSPDHSFVLVAESFKHRVQRYWLKGPKAGTSEVFVSRLPGMPDNIRARKNGGYYLSLVTCRDPDVTDSYAVVSKFPAFRRLLARLFYSIQFAFNTINFYYPNEFSAKMYYKIFNLGVIATLLDNNVSVIVEVDENGKIIGSLQGYSGRVNQISQTNHVGNDLFFGSPYVPYLGRLKLGETSKKPAAEKVYEKPASKDEL